MIICYMSELMIEYKLQEHLTHSLNPQCSAQCLAHSRCLVHILCLKGWPNEYDEWVDIMDEWMNE